MNNLDIVKFLIANRIASLNIKNKEGETPLIIGKNGDYS